MPRNHLARLVITRDALNGREAQSLGIVSMVAPAAKLAEEIARIRKIIGSNSAPVLRAVKAFPHRER